jgi:hypothetical protein
MSVGGQMSSSESKPTVVSPFGNMPFNLAGQTKRGFATPLSQAFGLGDPQNKQWQKFQAALGRGQGPLASFIQQATPITQSFLPGQQDLSKQLMSGAQSAYGGYQNSIDQFMKQLPGFQQTAATATGGGEEALKYSQGYAREAFSPLTGRAMYQEASRRMLAPAREAAAARGMLEGGQAQAGEQGMLSDLAAQALQNEQANQQAAVSQLGGAAGTLGQLVGGQAGIAGLGPQMQQQAMEAQQQQGRLLQAISQMPLQAAQQLMGFFQGAQAPSMALLSQVLPQIAQTSSSKSGGGNVGVSDRRLKREIRSDVPGLDAVLELRPVSFEFIPDTALGLAPGRHYGLVAQEVASVLPHAVGDQQDYLTIEFPGVVAVLVHAIQELAARVAELEEER